MSKRASGEGSIYKRADGKWVGVVNVGWADGVLKRRKIIATSQAEAVERMKELQKRVADGSTVAGDRLTVAQWLERWLETEAAVSVRPLTLKTYRGMVRKHLIPALGHWRLRKLEPVHVRKYMNTAKETLSARTVQQHHAILRRALRVAESYGYVPRNVARVVTPPTVKRPEIVPMTAEEVKKFLSSVRGDRLEPAYKVAMATGLRQSELLGLTWSDVDFEAATLRVTHTLQRYGGGYHLDEPKTDRSRRTLALAAPVVEALRAQRTRQREERLRAGSLWKGEQWGLVFAAEDGGPLYGQTLTREFQAALTRAEISKFRFHDLRHGAATFLLNAGVELIVVQRILGHSTIHTTANIYAHVLPELQRDAAERIGSAIFGATGS